MDRIRKAFDPFMFDSTEILSPISTFRLRRRLKAAESQDTNNDSNEFLIV